MVTTTYKYISLLCKGKYSIEYLRNVFLHYKNEYLKYVLKQIWLWVKVQNGLSYPLIPHMVLFGSFWAILYEFY